MYEKAFRKGGGSYELETAKKLGMTAVQAVWYLIEGTGQPSRRKQDFVPIEKPLDVLRYLDKYNRLAHQYE